MRTIETIDRKIIKWISIVVSILTIVIAGIACTPKTTIEGVNPYYTKDYSLPHTQSRQHLAEYLSSEHLEYDLDGWFFFGSLVDSSSPDNPGMFLISMQRIAQDFLGIKWQTVPAVVAFNGASLVGYIFGGDYTLDADPFVKVTSNPWKVEVNSLKQAEPLISMSLVSGTMGEAGALYLLTSKVSDQMGGTLEAEVQVRDRFGVVNQGYGSASFFPQFLLWNQRDSIRRFFGNSVYNYLETTLDPMYGQGSFYYSLPLLDVEQFSIKRDGILLSSGTSGTMWMDQIVQSYDAQAREALIGKAWWEFYSIMLPEEDTAIMVIQIKSGTGTLPVATLFKNNSERTRNDARKAAHSWNIDQISIEPVPGGQIWISPTTNKQYVQEHRIRLGSTDYPADLTIKMVRENQEIVVTIPGKEETIKYEGLATVTGTLAGKQVNGTAVVELQPFGSQ